MEKIFKWQYFVCSSLHSMFFYAKKMARKGWLYYAILRNKSIWIKLKGMGENHTFIYTKKKRYRVIKIWCLFYGAILLGHYYTYCSLHTIIIIYMYVTKRLDAVHKIKKNVDAWRFCCHPKCLWDIFCLSLLWTIKQTSNIIGVSKKYNQVTVS